MQKRPHNPSRGRGAIALERRLEGRLRAIQRTVRLTRAEVHDIAVTLEPLVDHVAHVETALHEIGERFSRIEADRPMGRKIKKPRTT